jgi:hypothetical protein
MYAGRTALKPVDSEHCRAICDEIGDRLRDILDRDAHAPSPYLLRLVSRLGELDQDAPSIVPSIEDILEKQRA